nr:MAG TPA: hypothetical protein [Caudoviricetes sp.]
MTPTEEVHVSRCRSVKKRRRRRLFHLRPQRLCRKGNHWVAQPRAAELYEVLRQTEQPEAAASGCFLYA